MECIKIMNRNDKQTGSNSEGDPQPITSLRSLQLACGHGYQAVLRRLAAVRAGLEHRFGRGAPGYERLVRSAINEAEALAWQTPYPHLFFPTLAEEKAAEVQHWAAHQREVYAWHYTPDEQALAA